MLQNVYHARRKGGEAVFATRCVAYEVSRYAARDVCKFCLAMLQMHAAQNPQTLARALHGYLQGNASCKLYTALADDIIRRFAIYFY